MTSDRYEFIGPRLGKYRPYEYVNAECDVVLEQLNKGLFKGEENSDNYDFVHNLLLVLMVLDLV